MIFSSANTQDGGTGKAFDVSKLPKGISARRGRPGMRAAAAVPSDKEGKKKDRETAAAPRVKKVRSGIVTAVRP